MEMLASLKLIAENSPFLFLIGVITFAIIKQLPKIFDYLISNKKIELNHTEQALERFAAELKTVQKRCKDMELESNDWRNKFFDLKQRIAELENENLKLTSELQYLKKNDYKD